jgi:hypothetical protein
VAAPLLAREPDPRRVRYQLDHTQPGPTPITRGLTSGAPSPPLLSKYISGSKQWTYEQEIVWTGNGSTISAYTPTDNSNYKATGWTWSDSADDATSTYTSGGVQYKRKRTNGWYGFACVSGVCLDEDLPWVKSTVGGDGSYANNGKGW